MANKKKLPTILIVTPEITYLPDGMGNLAQRMSAKAGGLADVSASLVKALHEQGADVHVTLPNYRRMFHLDVQQVFESEHKKLTDTLEKKRIHLAEDRIFYHRDKVYSATENHRISLAFQREVINNIIPAVKPDLIHCNDWMTGLIPAAAKGLGIPCLFTVHNIHTERLLLSEIEDRGINAPDFWEHLYYEDTPTHYEDVRENNHCNFLASALFSSNHVNSVSTTFLHEVVEGKHNFVPDSIRNELAAKLYSGNASGILNAPDSSFCPKSDQYLEHHFDVNNFEQGKAENKRIFQEMTGLQVNPDAPLFLWPSRLDPVQKGCQLLADILYQITSDHSDIGLQVGIVANGSFKEHLENIVNLHDLHDRVAIIDFSEKMSHLGYAAADYMMMPSFFEPCGLPQMVAPKYGTIPVVHDTGGIHDTVENLNYEKTHGNGFSFQHYSSEGLKWAVDEAIHFFKLPKDFKAPVIQRIMNEANARFNHEVTASEYIARYEQILDQKVTKPKVSKKKSAKKAAKKATKKTAKKATKKTVKQAKKKASKGAAS